MTRSLYLRLLALAPLLATPVTAQPDLVPPDYGLPPSVDRLCDGAVVPDLAPGDLEAFASASEEQPPLPKWCNGTCTIDIAFFYDPEAIGQADGPKNVGELRRDIEAGVHFNNIAWRRAGLDARLRIVGVERDVQLNGLTLREALRATRRRLPETRARYGADLLYAIVGTDNSACGRAVLRVPEASLQDAAGYGSIGAVLSSCLGENSRVLSHEVGHNLGLDHDPANTTGKAFVPFGHGYQGKSRLGESYSSIMAQGGGTGVPAFSTPEPQFGLAFGNAHVSDAVRALRYTIPDATRYSPTVVPEERQDPHGYGCRPSGSQACLNKRRFKAQARYSTPTVSQGPAKRLDTYGLGDSGALFYFFGADNPEMLLKVVNGCWLNDHWWVFGSAATDLAYEIVVEDLADGGQTVEYRHNGGGVIVGDNGYSTAAGVINDTHAFPCGGTATVQAADFRRSDDRKLLQEVADVHEQSAVAGVVNAQGTGDPSDHGCLPGSSLACLNNGRFGVSARYSTPTVSRVVARQLASYGLGDSGALFYFFGPDNPEMLLKVVNGCAINGHYWVFGSAATDLRYEVWINDYATARNLGARGLSFGRWNRYSHHGGGRITGDRSSGSDGFSTRAGVIADTTALPCTP